MPETSITRHTPVEELPDLLRVEEVARKLGVSRGVIYTMAESGELPSVRLGRLLRIPRAAIVKLIAVAQ